MLAFLLCGIATGCKYNGVLLLPAMVFMIWFAERNLHIALKNVIGGMCLFCIPMLIAIPKAVVFPVEFLSYIYSNFWIGYLSRDQGWGAGSRIGLLGQWGVIVEVVGTPLVILFLCLLLYCAALAATKMGQKKFGESIRSNMRLMFLLLCTMSIEGPLLVSRVYFPRYFVPIIPFLIVASCVALQRVWHVGSERKLTVFGRRVGAAALICLVSLSLLRIVSLGMLFAHDARYAAESYLQRVAPGSRVEYLMYPPNMPSNVRGEKYPFQYRLFKSELLRSGMNMGCPGLFERAPKYFVWDSFTYKWNCGNPEMERMQESECECWREILSGGSRYKLSGTFSYALPWYLPRVQGTFVNPEIKVYELSLGPLTQ